MKGPVFRRGPPLRECHIVHIVRDQAPKPFRISPDQVTVRAAIVKSRTASQRFEQLDETTLRPRDTVRHMNGTPDLESGESWPAPWPCVSFSRVAWRPWLSLHWRLRERIGTDQYSSLVTASSCKQPGYCSRGIFHRCRSLPKVASGQPPAIGKRGTPTPSRVTT